MTTIPTSGFNVESIEYKGITFTTWDVGGRCKSRALFRHYYKGTDALIWVVDSNDRDRMEITKDELHRTMNDEEMSGVPVLVFANKQDLPNALSAEEVAAALGLHAFRHDHWYIEPCNATTGNGLYEGLDWLKNQVEEKKKKKGSSSSSSAADASKLTFAAPPPSGKKASFGSGSDATSATPKDSNKSGISAAVAWVERWLL